METVGCILKALLRNGDISPPPLRMLNCSQGYTKLRWSNYVLKNNGFGHNPITLIDPSFWITGFPWLSKFSYHPGEADEFEWFDWFQCGFEVLRKWVDFMSIFWQVILCRMGTRSHGCEFFQLLRNLTGSFFKVLLRRSQWKDSKRECSKWHLSSWDRWESRSFYRVFSDT